ncbi:MAG: hypothetical protein WAV55_09865 [Clostridiaceae bacterium]
MKPIFNYGGLFDAKRHVRYKNLLHAGQPNILFQYILKKGNAGEALRKSAFVAKMPIK